MINTGKCDACGNPVAGNAQMVRGIIGLVVIFVILYFTNIIELKQ
jgi:hypothetical protein